MNLLIPVLGLGTLALLLAKKNSDDAKVTLDKAADIAKSTADKAIADKIAADKLAEEIAASKKAADDKAAADKAEADRLAGLALSTSDKKFEAKSPTKLSMKKDTDPLYTGKVMCLDIAGIATPFQYQTIWMGQNGKPIGPTVVAYLLNNPKAKANDFNLLVDMLVQEEIYRNMKGESASVTDDIHKLMKCLQSEKSRRFP